MSRDLILTGKVYSGYISFDLRMWGLAAEIWFGKKATTLTFSFGPIYSNFRRERS